MKRGFIMNKIIQLETSQIDLISGGQISCLCVAYPGAQPTPVAPDPLDEVKCMTQCCIKNGYINNYAYIANKAETKCRDRAEDADYQRALISDVAELWRNHGTMIGTIFLAGSH